MTTANMKPCPWCGGEAEIVQLPYNGTAKELWQVSCVEGCCVKAAHYGLKPATIKSWNKRVKCA